VGVSNGLPLIACASYLPPGSSVLIPGVSRHALHSSRNVHAIRATLGGGGGFAAAGGGAPILILTAAPLLVPAAATGVFQVHRAFSDGLHRDHDQEIWIGPPPKCYYV
jgi:hypothetical protein